MIWKIITLVLLATVKTLFAPAAGFAAGLSFWTTFAATVVGGIIGFVAFYFLFDVMSNFYYKNRKKTITAKQIRKARKIVMMRQRYPIWLFVFILPFTSIPVMAVIVRRFFNHNKPVFALSLVAVTLFALVGCLMFSPIQYL
ncbi:MAG: hypothetical protein II523_02440 [Bacteroidales bacterium]|nr:hypothetical protein [Bacteroidales bacterium]